MVTTFEGPEQEVVGHLTVPVAEGDEYAGVNPPDEDVPEHVEVMRGREWSLEGQPRDPRGRVKMTLIVLEWVKNWDRQGSFKAEDLARELGVEPRSRLYKPLSKMVQAGVLVRPGKPGVYAAGPTDPNDYQYNFRPKPTSNISPNYARVTDTVRAWVSAHEGGPFRAGEVAADTGLSRSQCATGLATLEKKEVLARIDRGLYRKTGAVEQLVDDHREALATLAAKAAAVIESGDIFEVVGHVNGHVLVRNAQTHEVYELKELSL